MTLHQTELGEKYVDTQTGITGIAVSSTRYQHGCERIVLEYVVDGTLKTECFDAPRLMHAGTGASIDHDQRPGGNQPVAPRPAVPSR